MKNNNAWQELFIRHPQNPILTIKDWPYHANSIFNCAATLYGDETILLVRVEDRRGISHLTVARSMTGISDWKIETTPALMPGSDHHPEEVWGIEDPRITYLDEFDEYLITYTAYSEGGPLVALAKTKDFMTYTRLGPIMPPEDKDAALFPIRFNGRWAILHRPVTSYKQMGAHIWISFSPDLKHWGDHQILMHARNGGWWDANKIGLSPPPIRISQGWLVLYHGVKQTAGGAIYRLGLALLDYENPLKLLRRSDEWIFGPQEHYEREGDVDDVVFPCGWILKNGTIYLYYGAADTVICLAKASLCDIEAYIKTCPEGS